MRTFQIDNIGLVKSLNISDHPSLSQCLEGWSWALHFVTRTRNKHAIMFQLSNKIVQAAYFYDESAAFRTWQTRTFLFFCLASASRPSNKPKRQLRVVFLPGAWGVPFPGPGRDPETAFFFVEGGVIGASATMTILFIRRVTYMTGRPEQL